MLLISYIMMRSIIKRLQQDVLTRWNSTVCMLQRLHEQKHALSAYVADSDLPSMFTGSQWKLVENMISLLGPFEEITQRISSSYASASYVIPSIRAHCPEKTAETDHGVKRQKPHCRKWSKKYFLILNLSACIPSLRW